MKVEMKEGIVKSVCRSETHTFSKSVCNRIILLKGLGVEGDAHMGKNVKHRSRVAIDPNQLNLRQVHLIHAELFDELKRKGFNIQAGEIGENITTEGIDLLSLSKGTILKIGETVKIEVTGLRNPCKQLDELHIGLMKAVLDQDKEGNLIRKAGIMGIVLEGGEVKVGNKLIVEATPKYHVKLERV